MKRGVFFSPLLFHTAEGSHVPKTTVFITGCILTEVIGSVYVFLYIYMHRFVRIIGCMYRGGGVSDRIW